MITEIIKLTILILDLCLIDIQNIFQMKKSLFSGYKVFACNSHPELAQEIAEYMGIELGKSTVTKFSDGEISVSIWESVREYPLKKVPSY